MSGRKGVKFLWLAAVFLGWAVEPTAAFADGESPEGYFQAADLATIDQAQRNGLSAQEKSTLRARDPKALVISRCALTLVPGESPARVLLLATPNSANPNDYRVNLLVVSSSMDVTELDWTEGPDWSYSPERSVDQGEVFIGTLRCVQPGDFHGFIRRDDLGRNQLRGPNRPAPSAGSVCLGFDETYANWQCFAWSIEQKAVLRWWYQVHAD